MKNLRLKLVDISLGGPPSLALHNNLILKVSALLVRVWALKMVVSVTVSSNQFSHMGFNNYYSLEGPLARFLESCSQLANEKQTAV